MIPIQRVDFFSSALFFYFLTLHADQLHLNLAGFTLRVNNLAAIVLILCFLARFRLSLISLNKTLVFPLLGIALSIFLSLICSAYPKRCFFYAGWYAQTVLCYVFLPYLLMKMWDAKKVLILYAASFLCVGLYAFCQLILSAFHIHDPFATQFINATFVRPNAFCFEPSFYALYMTPFVFAYNAYFLMHSETKKWWLLFSINFLYVISTSASVIFGYLIFFVLIFFTNQISRKRALRYLLGFSTSMLAVVCIFPFIMRHFFLKFFYFGFMNHQSFYQRWLGIENGWKIFLSHPFLGVGLGGYPSYLMDAYLHGDNRFHFLPIENTLSEMKNPVKLFEATSTFTELLASLGILGFAAFSWLLLSCFRQLSKVSATHKPIAYALGISLAVTLVLLQFNQGLFRTYIWTHLAITLAYTELYAQPNPIHCPSQL